MRLQFAQRIGHLDCGRLGRKPALDQGVRHALVPAANGQGVAQPQQAVMGAVGFRFGMKAQADPRGHAVQTAQPGDLLDQVDLARQVVAKRRRLPARSVVVRGGDLLAADAGQVTVHIGRRDLDAQQTRDFSRAQRDGAPRGGRFTRDGRSGRECCARQFDQKGQRAIARRQQRARIDPALVAVRRIGNQPQPTARAAHRRRQEPRRFQHNLRGGLGHAGRLAAHHARERHGARFIRDDQIVRRQLVSLVVQRLELFARVRAPHFNRATRQLRRVEGVERLARLEQDIVRDIDHVIDRTMSRRLNRLLQPERARAHLHIGQVRRGIIRAEIRRAQLRRPRRRRRWEGNNCRPQDLEFARAGRRDFARHAEIRKQVGPIGRDLHLEDRVARLVLVEKLPHRRIHRKNEQALGVLRDGQLLRGAEHPLGKLAAQLRFLDREIARQLRPRQRQRDLVAILVILRAADDLPHALAIVHLADPQPVRVRVLDGRKNLPDHDIRAHHPRGRDMLHLRAGQRQLLQHLGNGNSEVNIVAKPAQREFHGTKTAVCPPSPKWQGRAGVRTTGDRPALERPPRPASRPGSPRAGSQGSGAPGTFAWRPLAGSSRFTLRSSDGGVAKW